MQGSYAHPFLTTDFVGERSRRFQIGQPVDDDFQILCFCTPHRRSTRTRRRRIHDLSFVRCFDSFNRRSGIAGPGLKPGVPGSENIILHYATCVSLHDSVDKKPKTKRFEANQGQHARRGLTIIVS